MKFRVEKQSKITPVTEHLCKSAFENISLPAKLIWLHIALHDKDKIKDFSYDAIKAALGLSEGAVHQGLKSLKESGLLEVLVQSKGRVANEYRAIIPKK